MNVPLSASEMLRMSAGRTIQDDRVEWRLAQARHNDWFRFADRWAASDLGRTSGWRRRLAAAACGGASRTRVVVGDGYGELSAPP